MKANKQRKMLRAIASKTSQQRNEVARISQAQEKVSEAFDFWKHYNKSKAQPKMGGLTGTRG